MRITAELQTNPGRKILFLAELRIEKNIQVTAKWWGLWLGWWLYKPKHWREWLWEWRIVRDGGWFTVEVRLLGFTFDWQRKGYAT